MCTLQITMAYIYEFFTIKKELMCVCVCVCMCVCVCVCVKLCVYVSTTLRVGLD